MSNEKLNTYSEGQDRWGAALNVFPTALEVANRGPDMSYVKLSRCNVKACSPGNVNLKVKSESQKVCE